MDRRGTGSVAKNIYKFFTLCQIIRHILHACLLVVSVESQTDTTKTPALDYYRSITQIAARGRSLMRYCDTDKPIYDDDKFCNRVVAIVAHREEMTVFGSGQIIAPGIFIDTNRILTSYSPFRNLRHHVKRAQMYIQYSTAKLYNKTANSVLGYYHDREQILCARQVSPMEDSEIVEDQWHGPDHTHTPLHDLMIMKVENEMEFLNESSKTNQTFELLHYGPILTKVASKYEEFPEKFKFLSLGFIDNDHIYKKNHLHTSREYDFDDKVREDCDEWFPRDWGYFFCIKNDEDYVGIGSGAFLVGDEKVFGVGSFALKKGKQSILVFTDVRPYIDAMNMTCNAVDGH